MQRGNDYELISHLAEELRRNGLDPEELVSANEAPVFEKYDDYIPADLLRHAYAVDKLDPAEVTRRIAEIEAEY
jgi:ATP-dependent Lhr-like helicase